MTNRPEYSLLKTGEQIRKLRKERKISVEHMRDYLQLGSAQAIYKWENGKCFPQADNLMALAKLFNISPTQIMVEDKSYIYQEIIDKILLFKKLNRECEKKAIHNCDKSQNGVYYTDNDSNCLFLAGKYRKRS